ncbi:GAF domain-containing protein [Halobaculum sp. D14]|uniref:GAF domain-containing protein n=1 Tax=Halobaculum sp. D14 TaxID=3421642 RepID=UPI003EB821D1
MNSPLTILVAGADTGVARALAARDVTAELVDPGDVADAVRSLRPDAAVLAGDVDLDADAVDALDAAGAPVVAFGAEPPAATYVDGFALDSDDPVDALLREVRQALDGETRLQLQRTRRRVTRLHDSAASIAACRSIEELFDRTADAADRVLAFDQCWVGVRDGDSFLTKARVGDSDWPKGDRVDLDEGVAGETYRTGKSRLVADTADSDVVADPYGEIRSLVSVPVGDSGVLQAASATPNAFTARDLELAELLATHVGQAYGRLRAEADLRSRQRTVTELHEAAPELIDAESRDDLFGLTVDIAERVLAFDRSYLLVAEDDRFAMAATSDPDAPESVPLDFGVVARTHETGRSFVVEDVYDHPVAESSDADAGHSRSLLSVPVGDDAVFQAVKDSAGSFDDRDLELAELLVSYVTATLERIRSEAALRESRRVIERLHAASATVAAAETEQELLDRTIDVVEDVLSLEKSTLLLRDGDVLVPVAESAGSPENAARPMHVSEGLSGKTLRTGESSLVDRVDEHEDADPARPEYRSGISVPVGDLGVFQAVSTEYDAFDEDDLNRAELLMTHVAVSLERVRAEEDLRAERDRLSALFENIPDAAVSFEMVDGKPIARSVNSAFEETFGYDADDVVGANVDDFLVPEDAAEQADELNERLRRGDNVRRECRRRTADGVRDFLMYVVPLTLGEQNVRGYAIYSDITERKERERALERQNERLDEFASVVSHDLRNPISIAEGYLELARETGDEAHLDTVADAIERMRSLIEDLLALAREGRVVGDPEPVDLSGVAREAWAHVDTADATLQVDVDAEVPADEDRLHELFENLFRNAVEHAGSDAEIRVESLADADGFAVCDDGPGVPADQRDRVFEAGVTTSEEGTGFGLPIVRRIAEAHGWTVELGDSDDGGACFRFTFD